MIGEKLPEEGMPLAPFRDRLALRPNEAARALGISERTLRKWRRDEGLPYVHLDGSVLIPVTELERWMAERVRSRHTADQLANEILRDI